MIQRTTNRLPRKVTHWLVVLLSVGAGLAFGQLKRPAKRPPNIIFIVADDLGYGEVSCYGQQRYQTPNIDRLASEGLKFTQGYAGTAVCSPSRSSFFTGQHTGHTPVRGNLAVPPEGQYPLPASSRIIPQLLKQAGYATGCFGKWGLGGPGSSGDPVNQGIDEFFGYNSQTLAHNYYPYYLWHNREKIMLPENRGSRSGTYAPELIQQHLLAFIEQHQAQPFAVFMTTPIPHAELVAPPAYMQQTIGKYGPEKPYIGPDTSLASFTKTGAYLSQPHPRAAVVAMMQVLDDQVGQIMHKLKQLNLDDNTLVIFTSDNGPSAEGGKDLAYFNSSGGLRGAKRDLYEGGVRVPFIVRWPGRVKAGTVTPQLAAFWDLLPTFMDVAGLKTPAGIDGVSLLPTLTGLGRQQQHPYLYWEFYEQGGSVAARWGKWKAVRLNMATTPNGPIELYDLTADPSEKHDVASQHPDVIDHFAQIFTKEHVPSPVFHFQPKKAAAVE
ncbi:arylsulfatase [Hymenobacter sp. GOD-10R]|uniref:arylsulfatase n=1 Tax=Hymenobacter sp. GOD-10R TaxID=3093922 RepID=UPI002D78DFB2|nr:arylsulfatase [Hymenobacter sp. GOD-10R]WRQ31154.1 arylsulfatase [Hymenobacter sp. GOD-10R]